MRRIVLSLSISLDGYIEGPDRDISWHRVDAELHRYLNTQLAPMGAFLSGRTTWQLMAAYWPTADQDPDATEEIADFAAIWRDKPKVVYSTTLQEAGWNTTIARSVVPAEVTALRDAAAGDLAVGGADLAAAFLAHDLVDELCIYVHPVLVGAGKSLFPAAGRLVDLDLTETRRFGNGVVLLRYEITPPNLTQGH